MTLKLYRASYTIIFGFAASINCRGKMFKLKKELRAEKYYKDTSKFEKEKDAYKDSKLRAKKDDLSDIVSKLLKVADVQKNYRSQDVFS
jgi:hypothetical protein